MTDPLSRTHIIALDAADPLRPLRNDFLIPRHKHNDSYSTVLSINSRSIPYEYVINTPTPDEKVAHETFLYVSHAIEHLKVSETVALVPFSTHEEGAVKDSEMSQVVIDKIIKNHPTIKPLPFMGGDLLSALKTARMSTHVITTRFHGMIISLISGCHVAALDYSDCDGKSTLFYKSLSLQPPSSKAYEFNESKPSDFISISNNNLKLKLERMNQDYQNALP